VTAPTGRPPTLREAVGAAVVTLAAAGVPSPRPDAEELACHLLGIDRKALPGHLEDAPPAGFDALVARRADRVPLQHLTGRAYFRTLTLQVGPGVFVPRPETEVVVEAAIALVGRCDAEHPVVVDLGAGSGAIALALACEVPRAVVHAVEADPAAVSWLERNTEGSRVVVHHQDLADELPLPAGQVDLVVSNPPYIPDDAVPRDPEVARHDPPRALYSGPDGLDAVRAVERAAARLLRPGGWVVVEHADQQGRSAPAVFEGAPGWCEVRDWPDLTGRDRYLTAQRSVDEEVR